nr:unnamed protein product [Callosobruchus chinensis]
MYLGSPSTTIINSSSTAPWDKFGKELILTFVVVFSYFISMDTYRKWVGTSSLTIGSTYAACSFVSMPHLNPARSLGPAFVLNKWESHWVYWLGPLLGGVLAGIIYEYIFNPKRHKRAKQTQDEESSSIHSDDVDNFDDLDKPATYNNYRQSVSEGPDLNYCGSLYSAPKLERQESIYGGTKSLYCNSPSLTRPNLNRSQSVYAKSNTFINKDILPKNGPLVPTQSMYPIKINQQSHIQNQNVQNFLQQKNEGNYAGRAGGSGPSRPETHTSTNELKRDNYAVERQAYDSYSTAERQRRDKDTPQNPRSHLPNVEGTEAASSSRSNRPESMYGRLNSQARHVASAAQSDDSNYSSYTANSSTRNGYSASYHNSQKPYAGGYSGRCSENRANQNTQVLAPVPALGSYHHQHSPNPPY